MPFCLKCGTELGENQAFCHSCGNKIETPQTQAVPPQTQAVPPQTQAVPPSPSGKSMTTVHLLSFLLGLLIFGIGNIYIGRTTRGILFLCAGIGLSVFSFILGLFSAGLSLFLTIPPWLAIYLWQGFDAHNQAKKLGIT